MRLVLAAVAFAPVLMLTACGEAPVPEGDVTTSANQIVEAAENIAIPAAYHGVWDYEGGTCSRYSDMRMEVTATDITYYESYGKVTGTRPEGGDLIVDLTMEGEGDQWNESQRLSIVGTGTARRIHVTNAGQPKTADEYPRKPCP